MKRIQFLTFLFACLSGSAQIIQPVRGILINDLGLPLSPGNIRLSGDTAYQTTTDSTGRFAIANVAVGRYQLAASFVGYETSSQELLVIAGKSAFIEIALKPGVLLPEVAVTNTPNVEFDPGNYPLSIEKTMRVPANFFDPVRLATSLPGVVAVNDQSNSISIKGYSPNAMIWRLEGLDIVSPNHLANAGTLSDKPAANGGGVSILSSQVLDKTDFYSGPLPVRFGNVLSGAMDMQMRPGSAEKAEHTIQASLLGIDLATEGPLSKKKNSSYLVNYRYSTVGLLSGLGINFGDEEINFQDLSLHFNFKSKRHTISLFGFGGISSNHFDAREDSLWEEEKDRYTIVFKGQSFGLGVTDKILVNDQTLVHLGAAFSGQHQERTSQSALVPLTAYIYSESYEQQKQLFSGFVRITRKASEHFSWEGGVYATLTKQKLDVTTVTPLYLDDLYPNVHGRVDGVFYQPYLAGTWRAGTLLLEAGFRYVFYDYNDASSPEPRITLRTRLLRGDVALSYGITSQAQQIQTYLASGNQDLALTRSHDWTAQYKKYFPQGLSFSLTGYYHQLFDVPVDASTVPFSTLNQLEDFVPAALTNSGFGRNYGAEGFLEKKFANKTYFLLSASTYASGYAGSDKVYYTSRFNGQFNSSLSGGKEWSWENKAFGIHARVIYFGGLREMQIDRATSAALGTTIYFQNGYTQQLPNYSRLDLRLSWRKNKPGYTRTLSLDIQNVLNHENMAYHYYDTFQRDIRAKYQLGIIPVLVYRVDL